MATFLESSGYLDIGSGSGTRNVNGVFGRGNAISNYRSTSYYTTGGSGTFPANDIVLPDTFWGKGPDPAFSANYSGSSLQTNYLSAGSTARIRLSTDGTVNGSKSPAGAGIITDLPKNWYLPTTAGIGSSYYFRVTSVIDVGSDPEPATAFTLSIKYNGGATTGSMNTWYSLSNFADLEHVSGSADYYAAYWWIEISNNASTVLYNGFIWVEMNNFNAP